MKIPKPLLPLLQKKKRFKIVIGGRGSGKSMTIGDLCLKDAQTQGIKTACFREYQNSIDDSVLALLAGEIDRLELEGFDVQTQKILYGGEDVFKFKGMARNPEGIKSMYGFKRFWVEEGQTISYASLKALTPTLREEDSEIWISANLRSMADPFSQRFFKPFEKELRKNKYYEDDLHLIIWVNYDDNPLFPKVLEEERAYDEKHLPKAMYNHIWLGETYDEVDGCIIPVEWFEAVVDAHKKLPYLKPEGAIICAHDPSDSGPDPKGFATRHGSVFTEICEEDLPDVNTGLDWALEKAMRANGDFFVWDGDGMGSALQRDVNKELEHKHMKPFMFKGSEGVELPDMPFIDTADRENNKTNRESLYNKRAQYAHRLVLRFYDTWRAINRGDYIHPDQLLSIDSEGTNVDELRAQVCRVPRKVNNNGKFQIMTKAEMAKKPYELPSPNMFDSMMMAMYIPEVRGKKARKLKFKGL